jgi:hypothetical protein
MHPVHCPAPATGAAVRAGHLLRCVAPLCVFRRENSGFGGWGTSQYHLYLADLLFLSEVSHSLLVASRWAPLRLRPAYCVHPYLGFGPCPLPVCHMPYAIVHVFYTIPPPRSRSRSRSRSRCPLSLRPGFFYMSRSATRATGGVRLAVSAYVPFNARRAAACCLLPACPPPLRRPCLGA